MVLPGALFALFLMGFWLYCLTDALLTPASECRGMPKPAWVAVIAVTFIGGAAAWLIERRRPRRSTAPQLPEQSPAADGRPDAANGRREAANGRGERYLGSARWTDADDAVARHPAGRARVTGPKVPKGPDDDPEFLASLLVRAIRCFSVLIRAIRSHNPPVS